MSIPTLPHRERPTIQVDPRRVRGLGGAAIVARRELATTFLTRAFALSTLIFAAMALALPLLLGGGGPGAAGDLTLAHTAQTRDVAAAVQTAGGDDVDLTTVDGAAEGRTVLDAGDADGVLLAREDGRGFDVLVDSSLDPTLGALLSGTLQDRALRKVATDSGATSEDLASASQGQAVQVVAVGTGTDARDVLVGLAFAVGAVVVVLLWGIPLATAVLQEKVSRVVEILLTTVRPWQMLAGKVAATTVIGLTQLAVVVSATVGALALTDALPDLGGTAWSQAVVGVVCLILGIVTCCTLMAGLAARVERQEDLSSVLQPALALALVPLTAAVYLAFDHADSAWLDIASLAPVVNTFVLPARMALEPVPAWQVALSLLVGVLTAVAAFAVAGRVYAGAVLRSGGRVSLRDALQHP